VRVVFDAGDAGGWTLAMATMMGTAMLGTMTSHTNPTKNNLKQ
jgi:hypothetical protein